MLTTQERAVLAHVVIAPDTWYDHAVKTFGEQKAQAMLAAKVERHWQDYTRESATPDYKTRAERDTIAASRNR